MLSGEGGSLRTGRKLPKTLRQIDQRSADPPDGPRPFAFATSVVPWLIAMSHTPGTEIYPGPEYTRILGVPESQVYPGPGSTRYYQGPGHGPGYSQDTGTPRTIPGAQIFQDQGVPGSPVYPSPGSGGPRPGPPNHLNSCGWVPWMSQNPIIFIGFGGRLPVGAHLPPNKNFRSRSRVGFESPAVQFPDLPTRRFLSTKTRHRNTDSKIGPGG
jgi:hypothetical protein